MNAREPLLKDHAVSNIKKFATIILTKSGTTPLNNSNGTAKKNKKGDATQYFNPYISLGNILDVNSNIQAIVKAKTPDTIKITADIAINLIFQIFCNLSKLTSL
jgi:hypothetical protein